MSQGSPLAHMMNFCRSSRGPCALPCPLTPPLYKHICHMPAILGTETVHAVMINQVCRQCWRATNDVFITFRTTDATEGVTLDSFIGWPPSFIAPALAAPHSISNHLFGTTNMSRSCFSSSKGHFRPVNRLHIVRQYHTQSTFACGFQKHWMQRS